MSEPAVHDRLFRLLPQVYRQRDEQRGYLLRALLRVIEREVNLVEANIDELYQNWFIETCQDWVVPYIGDLLGYQVVPAAGRPLGTSGEGEAALHDAVLVPRREVARTIAFRRRKGTLALLELLAEAAAGWPARAVEMFNLLAVTQNVKHVRLDRGRTVDVRLGEALERLGGPFDAFAHTVDVHRIGSRHGRGLHNIPNLALFVWRLGAYRVTRTQAYCHEEVGRGQGCYTFSVLGNDAPLFTRPEREPDPTTIAGPLSVPAPILRRGLRAHLADYYGEDKSFAIWTAGAEGGEELVSGDRIVAADLADWYYRPAGDKVAVDPVLGRIAFPPASEPAAVRVTYHHGFPAAMGGGEYARPMPQPYGPVKRYEVGPGDGALPSVREALRRWSHDKPERAIIEIIASGAYTEQLDIAIGARQTLVLRAADGVRAVFRLLDYEPSQSDSLRIRAQGGGRVTLDGLLVVGRGVHVEGRLDELVIRHSTFVPNWYVHAGAPEQAVAMSGERRAGGERRMSRRSASLRLVRAGGCVRIERSIVGPIFVDAAGDPVALRIADSIVDASGFDPDAIGGTDASFAHATLHASNVTVWGGVAVHAIELAEDSIFWGCVRVARRQIGCVRFSYLPPDSRTPRRFKCQPDMAIDAARGAIDKQAARRRVVPSWNSTRYGSPAYGQLAALCPDEIARGAHDDGEMGAFHDLFVPQRTTILRVRLAEYVPASTEADVIDVT
jgi:hypothetical protein